MIMRLYLLNIGIEANQLLKTEVMLSKLSKLLTSDITILGCLIYSDIASDDCLPYWHITSVFFIQMLTIVPLRVALNEELYLAVGCSSCFMLLNANSLDILWIVCFNGLFVFINFVLCTGKWKRNNLDFWMWMQGLLISI